jgi:hypothetical protein
MMQINHLPFLDISPLEEVLVKDQLIIPVAYKDIGQFPQEAISTFCLKYGIYQIPTIELIDFLESEIADKGSAIEIGAGNGCFGRALNIKMIDNKMQLWPEVRRLYQDMRQPTVNYGKDVEEISANDAVIKYKPHTVIGSWITEKWEPGMKTGNQWGVQEYKMFSDGIKKYIVIGNRGTHGNKKILKTRKVKKHKFPWLLSRSLQREDNVIYIFS